MPRRLVAFGAFSLRAFLLRDEGKGNGRFPSRDMSKRHIFAIFVMLINIPSFASISSGTQVSTTRRK